MSWALEPSVRRFLAEGVSLSWTSDLALKRLLFRRRDVEKATELGEN